MQKILVKAKEMIKDNEIYWIGVLCFTYKAILLNLMLQMNIGKEMYLICMAIPMLILLPCLQRKSKKALIYANIAYFIVTFLIYSNYIYYQYSTNFISVYQIDNLKYAEEIGMSLRYLISPMNLTVFFIDNILVTIASVFGYRFKKQQKEKMHLKITKIIFLVAILLLNTFLMVSKIERTYQYYTYNKTLMVEHIGIYYYHIEDIKEYLSELFFKKKVDPKTLEQIYNQSSANETATMPYAGIAKDSNVIILQLESMNEFVINKTINGKEITPNLNRFYQENIYCTDMYNQGLGTTADSEHTVATSMFPLENGRVFQKYSNNKWEDLYSNLKEKGYYTSFMHPNVSTFWNRYQIYAKGYQIDSYNDISQFEDYGQMAGEFFSDEQFFIQAVDKMKDYPTPFVSMMVAISTHIPYSLEGIENLEEKISIDPSSIESQEMQNYLLSCNFVDYSFGQFMQKLKAEHLLENTVLVVYGDHGAGLQEGEAIEQLYQENNFPYHEYIQKLEDTHVPFGMKVPGMISKQITNTVAKMDIKPTILDLLGVEDKFSLGQSIFSDKDNAFIKGIGYVTNMDYYIDGEYIDRTTLNKKQPTQKEINLTKQMEEKMILSDTIIKNNLLKK